MFVLYYIQSIYLLTVYTYNIEYVCVCVTVSKERCTGIPLSPSDGRISKIIQGYERNLRSSTRLSTMKMIRGGGWMLDDDTIDDHFSNYHTNRCSVPFRIHRGAIKRRERRTGNVTRIKYV